MNLLVSTPNFSTLRLLKEHVDQNFSAVAEGWNAEHKPDGRHSTITADAIRATDDGNLIVEQGITERGRAVGMGEWIDVPFDSSRFIGGTTTWTVTDSDATEQVMLIGRTMFYNASLSGTSTSEATAQNLSITPPFDVVPQGTHYGTGWYNENGTRGTVRVIITNGTGQIELWKADGADWDGSLSNSLSFELSVCFPIGDDPAGSFQ